METVAGYGLWPLVVLNTAFIALFAVSFFHPRTGRDWRAMGAFSAFLLALFTEMYGTRASGLAATANAGGAPCLGVVGWRPFAGAMVRLAACAS